MSRQFFPSLTHCERLSASLANFVNACARWSGSSQSMSRVAFRLEPPGTVSLTSDSISSGVGYRADAAAPASCLIARPSRFQVSSTRPAPKRGDESRAAFRCCQPSLPCRPPFPRTASEGIEKWVDALPSLLEPEVLELSKCYVARPEAQNRVPCRTMLGIELRS